MSEALRFFAPCPAGVEPSLADELRRLGLRGVRPQRSGVLFSGRVADGLRAVFWSRLASRVLLTLGEVDASDADTLYDGVRQLQWEDHLRAGGSLAVDAGGVNEALRNTQFTAVKAKDAIADRFRERFGRRPNVDPRQPDVRVNVAVRSNKATISIDLAGEPLHRRGYREPGVQVAAPMKETLAAAVLEVAGWRGIAESGGSFLDPMCGSGTLAIEAALVAGDVAPGWIRPERPVRRWLGFDEHVWQRMYEEADERRRQGLDGLPFIAAYDADPRAVEIARRCVQRAGLEFLVHVERADLSSLSSPEDAAAGLVATNPPWGERLSERAELPSLYDLLGSRLRGGFSGWRLAVVSPDPGLAAGLAMRSRDRRELGTGKGAATVTTFDVTTAPAAGVGGSDEFRNRLAKMAKHYGKWVRRAGVSCYRVYDADIPAFALAVDVYQGAGPDEGTRWVHVAEYAAPAEIDPRKAAERLDAAVRIVPQVLGVDPEAVFVKRRERQRGSTQYERQAKRAATGVVAEAGLLFEANFSDYLDTGIFLDHRDTRTWLGGISSGKRFLNLFGYTGTASVHAAAGGASETVTVDLSSTYLAWAERNMALNGLLGEEHVRVREDTLDWVDDSAAAGRSFDLVFCDPPTFSNSKRMDGTWDVQRDHGKLLSAVGSILAPDGLIVFSCNRRSFVLDEEALGESGLKALDITARTIPKDFERTPGVHRCWEIRHA